MVDAPKMPLSDNRYWAAFLAILAVCLAMSLAGLDRPMWRDEFSSLSFVGAEHLVATLRDYDHPPL